MNLYKLQDAMQCAMDNLVFDEETGEILSGWEAVEALDMELNAKLENYGCAYKNCKADADAIFAEIKRLQSRKKATENTMKQLSYSIKTAMLQMGKDKLSTPKVALSLHNREHVDADITKIPEEYKRYKDPEPNKTEIKKAIKSGIDVPGASLVTERNLQIK